MMRVHIRPRRLLVEESQVTLRQLLKEPLYKEWFRKPPVGGFPAWTRWRVYAKVSPDRGWAKRDFPTFREGFNFLAKNLADWHDAALVCTNMEFRPPVVRIEGKRAYLASVVEVPGHRWCGHCRRPTIFGFFSKHHAFTKTTINPLPYKKRCSICGISETAIKRYSAKKGVA